MERQRTVPVHYLRPNEASRTPKRVMFADTETSWTERKDGTHHKLRLWAATLVRRDLRESSAKFRQECQGESAADLCTVVENASGAKDAVWVYFHNLSFDLTVTKLPALLVQRGWEMYRHALTTDAPWASFRREGHHIHLCDSFSWLPKSLADIGVTLEFEKVPLPANDEQLPSWYARCRQDVRILERAMLFMMDEWDARQAGVWGITGTGSGFSHMRHVGVKRHVVIRPDADAQSWERGAISGGRKELWHRGPLPDRWFVNIDAKHAFASVCRDLPLPIDRWKPRESTPLDYYDLGRTERQLMADCLVETSRPRYPVKLGRSWFFPVGRFWTRLAGPELEEARQRGELLEIGFGYKYVCGDFMKPWAREIIDDLRYDKTPRASPWTIATKSWSRSVPGRWGLRTGRVEDETTGYGLDWSIEQAVYGSDFAPAAILTVPPLRQVIVRDQEAENSFPAVLAFIQSHVRMRLNRLIDRLNGAVVQCNTDGVIIDAAAEPIASQLAEGTRAGDPVRIAYAVSQWLCEHASEWAPLQFTVRKVFRGGRLITAQHCILGDELKLAGIPRSAVQTGPDQWSFKSWGKLPGQLSHKSPGEFVVTDRHASLAGAPVNRWATVNGACLPVRISQDKPGGPVEVLEPTVFETQPYGGLAASQHPTLHQLSPWLAKL